MGLPLEMFRGLNVKNPPDETQQNLVYILFRPCGIHLIRKKDILFLPPGAKMALQADFKQ